MQYECSDQSGRRPAILRPTAFETRALIRITDYRLFCALAQGRKEENGAREWERGHKDGQMPLAFFSLGLPYMMSAKFFYFCAPEPVYFGQKPCRLNFHGSYMLDGIGVPIR